MEQEGLEGTFARIGCESPSFFGGRCKKTMVPAAAAGGMRETVN